MPAHISTAWSESHPDTIQIVNPKTLGCDHLPAERIGIGVANDYKPCIALLEGGELAVVAFHQHELGGRKVREDMIWFTSSNGGLAWSEGRVLPLLGREPYLSIASKGTILITTHLLQQDVRNEDGYGHAYLHRLSDNAATWQTVKIVREDVPGAPEKAWICTSRNVLELADGTLILGVSAPRGLDYLWRSQDAGKTWDRTIECNFDGVDAPGLHWPFFAETVFWQARCGDILGLFRVDQTLFAPLPGTEIPQFQSDQFERLVVYRSQDGGRNWFIHEEMGSYYGEMYPAILRLQDGRLLLTFTVREMRPPLGVHAVLGEETDAGFCFHFENDRFVLDAKTPVGLSSGGGFGPTIQLADGTLATAYSYRDADNKTHLEIVRWHLPG